MKKIIAREVNPAHIDFSWYFEDDGMKSISGKNCACYIIPCDRRRNTGFNMEEYEQIEAQAQAIIEGFNDVSDKWQNGYNSFATYKEAMEYNGIPYTSRKCHLLKEWANCPEPLDNDGIALFLSITSGETWKIRAFYGYYQGDHCEVLYCPAHYSEEHITEIGKFWLGCGTEFCIDDCYGYFVIDEIRWREDEQLYNLLAEYACCEPEEIEIYLYTGEHTVSDYKLMEV